MMKRSIAAGLLLLLSCMLHAQEAAFKGKLLRAEEFINIVKLYHPVISQAGIAVQKAKAEITIARGAFDPSLYLNTQQKTFDGKNYYNYVNPELKVPTWFGIEVKAGLENNGGQFLTSEATTGQSSYAGISVPLAKNLLMDKRRAALQQAKIFKNLTEAEQRNVINDVLYEAYSAYWNWVQQYQMYQVTTNVVEVNKERFSLVKLGYRQGDRPAIDTTEALAQLQQFQYMQSEALVRMNNAALELSNFLWLPGNQYYQLEQDVIPDDTWYATDINTVPLLMQDDLLAATATHPKLQMYSAKLQWLQVERKLKFQSLLPTINLKTNVLNKGYNMFDGIGKAGFYENNNKFGLDIGLPLRLSEGRGGYRLAKLKLQETTIAQADQRQEIENKVRQYYNELIGLVQQVSIYENAYKNYQALYRGEATRYNAGESSLFLLNARENKQLEALQKLLELKIKYYKTRQAAQWAAGILQ
ncbi:MAG TPA: TolC family protein [Ferruginibacter sp.]|nr:TolC family protein [Ferruginibacter sp.]HMP21290.1 TolC family protein [Ferruginibacter sp.]